MKILSLFDGISCARVALDRANIPVEAYYASEIDKYAIQISQKNYPDITQIGNVTDIDVSDFDSCGWETCFCWNQEEHLERNLPFDLLIGGSPCQDLSIAGKREGLAGKKSSLFYEYVRILNEVKPKYFILENVNSMPKEAKETITKELFGIEPIMINASLVSAQNRKRLFWVGKLRPNGRYSQVEISLPDDKGIVLKDILETDVDEKYTVLLKNGQEKMKSNTVRTSGRGSGIDDKHNWDTIRIGQIGKGGQGDRIYSPDGKSVSLSALGGGRGAKTGLYKVGNVNQSGKGMNGDVHSSEGKSPTLTTNKGEGQKIAIGVASRTYPRTKIEGETRSKQIEFRSDEKANSMTSVQGDSMVATDTVIRKLTPVECERLQGVPDNYTDGISNSQRYKCLGNAFNADVIAHILSFLK